MRYWKMIVIVILLGIDLSDNLVSPKYVSVMRNVVEYVKYK